MGCENFFLLISQWAKRQLRRVVLVAPLCGWLFGVQGAVVIEGTRIIYPSDSKEVTVTLNNVGQFPALVQVWLDNGNEQMTSSENSVPFVLTPPIFRVEPSKGQTLRIFYTGEPQVTDRETLFFLNVLDIPPKPTTGGNYLQFSVHSRLKVFFRPAGLQPDILRAPEQIQLTFSGNRLTLNNPTPYYITPTALELQKAGRKHMITDIPMLLPFSQEEVFLDNLNFQHDVNAAFISYIDDLGKTKRSLLAMP